MRASESVKASRTPNHLQFNQEVVMIIIGGNINGYSQSVGAIIDKRDSKAIQDLAVRQVDAGAQVVDLNVGIGRDDAVELMKWLVITVQDAVDVTLSIDTPKIEVMKAGIDGVKGHSMMNSIPAEQEKMAALFPLAAEHDSEIICMTMDENFVLGDVDKRVEQAATLVANACEYGIDVEKLYIDPVCLPVSTAQDQAPIVIEAVRRISLLTSPTSVLKTAVGLNNISHDTKNPRLIERTFLAMLIGAGLSSAIINTEDRELLDTIKTCDVLLNKDVYAADYLRA
ncbi:MAG TPA: dihydropteroate synthase [Candidatus Bathyarchaeia archaeon]|nr:dihydropteroate synthase [Candidatus Bathyarchaeia archaeon]